MAHESEGRSAKRQRAGEPQNTIMRSNIWRDDGNIVLMAENVQFRVHRSQLIVNASGFSRLDELQLPNQHVEGCPLVKLPYSAIDVQHFLSALYDPLSFSEPKLSLSFLRAIVRVGRKFDARKLVAAAFQRLAYENPQTLEEYENLPGPVNRGNYKAAKYLHYRGVTMDVVTLARENELYTLLPCAYFRIVLYCDIDMILNGIENPETGRSRLSFEDQQLCLTAKQRIIEAQWRLNEVWTWLSTDVCAEDCTTASDNLCGLAKRDLFRNNVALGHTLIPFRLADKQKHLCDACNRRHVQVMAEARKKLWEELPRFFKLAPWAELKDNIWSGEREIVGPLRHIVHAS
ncbi:BTB domain-containing protein [Favolaschia claudopus]|uniref:BTB domain-containing protein n=1 Tax=Favolaschia claudopus TaxID=2862362 RepID=A0AAW0DUL5_9AGAR